VIETKFFDLEKNFWNLIFIFFGICVWLGSGITYEEEMRLELKSNKNIGENLLLVLFD